MSAEFRKKADIRFEKIATMLIASVAILVAVTAYFQNYAANLSDQARRRAQEYAINATKKEVNGVVKFSYQWQGAFQTWSELEWQIIAADQNGDTAAEERYEQLQDRIEALSPMLGPEYFDSGQGFPMTSKYESDTYLVESARLSEIYTAEAEIGRITDDIADSMVVQITLLTVSLSLYGLSITLRGRVRWLFILVGSGIVGVCMTWLLWSLISIATRPQVNMPAIEAYAEGAGLSYQGMYNEAILKFDEAIAQKPDYAKAYYERGNAYYYAGDLTTAIKDFETARNTGLNDTSTNWNLGWSYYLAGRYEEALDANNRVLADDPSVLGVRTNQALTYLAMGSLDQARQQYDLAIEEANAQVQEARQQGAQPSALLWYYMDASAADLQNLMDQLDNNPKYWTQAPTSDLIRGDHAATRQFAYEQMVRIKEAIVALEYTGALPTADSTMQVDPFIFGTIAGEDDQGFITDFEPAPNNSFEADTQSVTVEYTYSGTPSSPLIWKIYYNGREDQSLRVVSTDDISAGNTWYRTFGFSYTNVFVLSPGEYVLELYSNNRLVQRGTFYIAQ